MEQKIYKYLSIWSFVPLSDIKNDPNLSFKKLRPYFGDISKFFMLGDMFWENDLLKIFTNDEIDIVCNILDTPNDFVQFFKNKRINILNSPIVKI